MSDLEDLGIDLACRLRCCITTDARFLASDKTRPESSPPALDPISEYNEPRPAYVSVQLIVSKVCLPIAWR